MFKYFWETLSDIYEAFKKSFNSYIQLNLVLEILIERKKFSNNIHTFETFAYTNINGICINLLKEQVEKVKEDANQVTFQRHKIT